MTREQFDNKVTTIPEPYGFKSKIIYMATVHSSHGSTQQESEDNLWEYLIDEIGI